MDCVPIYTSELENDYPKLNDNYSLINVYGPIGSGKTTIIKTYMRNKNYHYIDNYNQTMEQFIDHLSKLTRVDVMSYFLNSLEPITLVIDNYDYFSFKYKDIQKYIKNFKIIIVSISKYFDNSIYIQPPSNEYLISLLYTINNLFNKNYQDVNLEGSFLKFFSSLEHGYNIEFDKFYSELECLSDIYNNKNIHLILYDINNVHVNYLEYVDSIESLSYLSGIISDSIVLNGTEYYQCLTNMVVYNLDSKITNIRNIKVNYHKKTKIQKECLEYYNNPLELSLVKKIKNKH